MNPSGPGHREVEQHDVGPLLAVAPDGGEPVVRGDDLVALRADERGDRPDHRRVVVDHEDPERPRRARDGHGSVAQTAAAAGRAITNLAPCPFAGSHHSRAPTDSASRRAAYSPMPEPRAVCVSRRAYGSKIRSRHSSGMPGPSSATPMRIAALGHPPVEADRRLRRRVLHGVLDEVLEDLAEAARVGQGEQPDALAKLEAVPREQRRELGRRLADDLADVGRLEVRRRLGPDPHGSENRVDQAVEALDLLHRRPIPARPPVAPLRVARFAALELGLLREQLGVGPHDGERRPQLVGDHRDELGAGLVDRLQLGRPRLGLLLEPALLDDARRAGRRSPGGGRRPTRVKSRGCSVWTLRTPTIRSFQTSGTESIEAMNRRWSMPRTHRNRSSLLTSGITSGSRDSRRRGP